MPMIVLDQRRARRLADQEALGLDREQHRRGGEDAADRDRRHGVGPEPAELVGREDAEERDGESPMSAAVSSKSTVKSAGSFDWRSAGRIGRRAALAVELAPGDEPGAGLEDHGDDDHEVVPADVAASGAGRGASAAPRRSRRRRRARRAGSRPRRPRSRAPCRGRTGGAGRPGARRAAGRRGAGSGCRCRRSNAPPRRTSPTTRWPPRPRICRRDRGVAEQRRDDDPGRSFRHAHPPDRRRRQ